MAGCDDGAAVNLFKAFLRFRTVSGEGPSTGTYAACCAWLESTCKELIPIATTTVVEACEKKPVLVVKLPGADPSLDAVVLNSHYDVVPAMEEHWDVDPWAAVEKDGRIYGRGTQDMKCVGAQYIVALARMYADKAAALEGEDTVVTHLFERNVFLTFVPDEEIGGRDGMGAFINGGHMDRLVGKVAVALDEGLANPTEDELAYTVFFGERMPLWILVTAEGPTGHGSRFIKDTAIEKLLGVANKAFAKRREQEEILGYSTSTPTPTASATASSSPSSSDSTSASDLSATGCKHCEAKKLGDVLTINLTVLQAGVSTDGGESFSINVVPTTAMAGFDIRVPVTTPIPEVVAMLDEWCAAEGMSWKFDPKTGIDASVQHAVSSTKADDKWWSAFTGAFEGLGAKIVPEIFPAGTDSRFLRQKGIPAFGFSPMGKSPILLHEHNEYLDKAVFLQGIGVYQRIIPALADLQ